MSEFVCNLAKVQTIGDSYIRCKEFYSNLATYCTIKRIKEYTKTTSIFYKQKEYDSVCLFLYESFWKIQSKMFNFIHKIVRT